MNTKSATSGLVIKTALILVAVGGAAMMPESNASTQDPLQTLDQVEVFSANKVLRLKFDPLQFVGLDAARQTRFRSCQSSNLNGLFCLDGSVVRNWPKATEIVLTNTPADAGVALFTCQDDAFGFDQASPGPCTSMTADVNGDVWLSGKKPGTGNVYNIVKVFPKGASCPVGLGSGQLTGKVGGVTNSNVPNSTKYCFQEYWSGRAPISDLSPVEGEFVQSFFPSKGILGVESGTSVLFYPFDGSQPIMVQGPWNLASTERIQSASILQKEVSTPTIVDPYATTIYTYGLVTTSFGQVLWRNLGTADPAAIFVHLSSTSDPNYFTQGPACPSNSSSATNTFRVRASEASGRVYTSNRNFCTLSVLEPVFDASMNIVAYDPDYSDIALTGASNPPDGISLLPGASVDLAKCSASAVCIPLGDGDNNGHPAVKIYGVTLEGPASSLMLYLADGIPDCRYILASGEELGPSHPCKKPGVIVKNPDDPLKDFPQRQYLNVTPMLPEDITVLFDDSGKKPFGLPPLLISPKYRGQASQGYKIEALFGVADPDIRFRKTFTVEFDIGDLYLAGASLGCGVHQTVTDEHPNGPLPFNEWDIVTMVSERYSSVGGPDGILVDNASTGAVAEHVDTLINKGCYNPTPTAGTRWSMYAYNLELVEDVAVGSGSSTTFNYSHGTTYLGNLLISLHSDLGIVQREMACKSVDAAGNTTTPVTSPPLSRRTCNSLETNWAGSQDKLQKCIQALYNPKESAFKQACTAFEQQFTPYKTQIEGLTPSGPDPANRVGELWSRTDVIKHIYYDHFLKARDLCKVTPSLCVATP